MFKIEILRFYYWKYDDRAADNVTSQRVDRRSLQSLDTGGLANDLQLSGQSQSPRIYQITSNLLSSTLL